MRKTELFTRPREIRAVPVGRRGLLTIGDALEFVQGLKSHVADLVFLDPPFNLQKDYGFHSELEAADPATYQEYLNALIDESCRVLRPGGSFFLYHMPHWATKFAPVLNARLEFRHWIAVAMKNGFVRRPGLYPAHYALLYFSKGTPSHFRRPRIAPQRCRHCGDYVKDYGGYRRIIERKGLNLSDIWEDLSPVRHRGAKHRRANQLPVELTNRVVQMAGRRKGLLVDPFVGSGTSLISAQAYGMMYLGNDLHAENIEITRARLRAKPNGRLTRTDRSG